MVWICKPKTEINFFSTIMNMKGLAFKSMMMATLLSLPMMLCGCNGNNKGKQETPVVYFTKDISPEALVKLYEALVLRRRGKSP